MGELLQQVFHHGPLIAIIPCMQLYFPVLGAALYPVVATICRQGTLNRIVFCVDLYVPSGFVILTLNRAFCFFLPLFFLLHVLFLEGIGGACGIGLCFRFQRF